MAYTDGIIVNEEFLNTHPEFKCEADDPVIEVGKHFAEHVTDWGFANTNCIRKWNVELNVTKDIVALYK